MKEQVEADLKIKSTFYSLFMNFVGSLLCLYPINKIESVMRLAEEIEKILSITLRRFLVQP
jgi:hypothetical protein